jgi:hypothetical protein
LWREKNGDTRDQGKYPNLLDHGQPVLKAFSVASSGNDFLAAMELVLSDRGGRREEGTVDSTLNDWHTCYW